MKAFTPKTYLLPVEPEEKIDKLGRKYLVYRGCSRKVWVSLKSKDYKAL
jgi:hypothetical protein